MHCTIIIAEFLLTSNGKAQRQHITDTVRIKDGWDFMSNICLTHLLEDKCLEDERDECEITHLWSINDDLHGRRGSDIYKRILDTLQLLAQYDVYPIEIEYNSNSPMKKWLLLTAFACHLKDLMHLALLYPQHYFLKRHHRHDNIILENLRGRSIPQIY